MFLENHFQKRSTLYFQQETVCFAKKKRLTKKIVSLLYFLLTRNFEGKSSLSTRRRISIRRARKTGTYTKNTPLHTLDNEGILRENLRSRPEGVSAYDEWERTEIYTKIHRYQRAYLRWYSLYFSSNASLPCLISVRYLCTLSSS